MNFTAKTRLLTLLGDPVLHSRSPEIQNRAFEAAGVDGVYVALQCKEEDLEGFMVSRRRLQRSSRLRAKQSYKRAPATLFGEMKGAESMGITLM